MIQESSKIKELNLCMLVHIADASKIDESKDSEIVELIDKNIT